MSTSSKICGWLCVANPDWLDFFDSNPKINDIVYYKGPYRPLTRLPIGAPFFCCRRTQVPRRIHLIGRFNGYSVLSSEEAWHTYQTNLGVENRKAWNDLDFATDGRVSCHELTDAILLKSPPLLDDAGVQLANAAAAMGRYLNAQEVDSIFRLIGSEVDVSHFNIEGSGVGKSKSFSFISGDEGGSGQPPKKPEADDFEKHKKKAFVLMPFSEPYNSYYPALFKPALEAAGYDVTRADDLFTPRPIMLDIQRSIVDADIILCEMSEKNPNVFYELGLTHAIGKPAILVSRIQDDIPFDLRHVRIIVYDTAYPGWEDRLRNEIVMAAASIEQAEEIWPPPLIKE